jgi:Cu/Zn superoxide dismutase
MLAAISKQMGGAMNIVRTFILASAMCALAAPASAEVIELRSELSAQKEVPSNPSPGSGRAEVKLDRATGQLSWTISFSGLSAPLSAAHFHGPATTESNAGIVVPIAAAGAQTPLTGSAVLTEAQVADILAGRWYINVHTPNYPGGEIRGQVVRP